MTTYRVYLKRTETVYVEVEAESPREAKEKAGEVLPVYYRPWSKTDWLIGKAEKE